MLTIITKPPYKDKSLAPSPAPVRVCRFLTSATPISPDSLCLHTVLFKISVLFPPPLLSPYLPFLSWHICSSRPLPLLFFSVLICTVSFLGTSVPLVLFPYSFSQSSFVPSLFFAHLFLSSSSITLLLSPHLYRLLSWHICSSHPLPLLFFSVLICT
jgi:hypothetical protein